MATFSGDVLFIPKMGQLPTPVAGAFGDRSPKSPNDIDRDPHRGTVGFFRDTTSDTNELNDMTAWNERRLHSLIYLMHLNAIVHL